MAVCIARAFAGILLLESRSRDSKLQKVFLADNPSNPCKSEKGVRALKEWGRRFLRRVTRFFRRAWGEGIIDRVLADVW